MANCKNRNKSFNGALGTLGGLFALPARQSGLFHKTTH